MNSNVKKNRDHARPLPARSGQPSSADSSPAGPDAAGPDAAGPDGRHKDGKHKDGKEGGSRWTFLTNHSHVLIVLDSEPELVLREVAARVGITERAVQRVVQDLEEGGFIRRERVGRHNRYEVLTDVPLRHSIESHRNIGDLLKLIRG